MKISDLRVDTWSNAKGVVAVRMTHIPTGLSVNHDGPFKGKSRVEKCLRNELKELIESKVV